MEFIKTEPESEPEPDGESYLTSACDQNELTGVKEDEDPLLVKCPLIKTEHEVSLYKAIAKHNDAEPLTIYRYRILHPEYFGHEVLWIRGFSIIWGTLSRMY
jgi:hypothetical protein